MKNWKRVTEDKEVSPKNSLKEVKQIQYDDFQELIKKIIIDGVKNSITEMTKLKSSIVLGVRYGFDQKGMLDAISEDWLRAGNDFIKKNTLLK